MTSLELIRSVGSWVLFIVGTEAATEIVVASELLSWPRSLYKRWVYPPNGPPRPDTVAQQLRVLGDKFLTCGYCVSVWVAIVFWNSPPKVMIPVASVLLVHRLANFWHASLQLVQRGRVKTYDVLFKEEQAAPFKVVQEEDTPNE